MPRRIKPVTRLRGRRASVSGIGLINGDATEVFSTSAAIAPSRPTISCLGVVRNNSGVRERIEFAEIPEIVFLRGVGEAEELGIYVLDPANRSQPGDLWWLENRRLQRHSDLGGGDWVSRAPVTVIGDLPAGVTFNPYTCQLTYDPTGQSLTTGHDRKKVRLMVNGLASPEFMVSVLKPKAVWGYGAEAVAAGYGCAWGDPDLGHTFQLNIRPSIPAGSSSTWETDPNVVYWLGGTYSTDASKISLPTTYWDLYLIGAAGATRTLVTADQSATNTVPRVIWKRMDGANRGLTFGFGLRNALFNETTGVTVEQYGALSQCTIRDHDSTRQSINGETLLEQDMATTYADKPDAHYPAWGRLFVSNTHLANRVNQSPLDHHMYVHGQGNVMLSVNNVKVGGGAPCSGIKFTARHVRIRNSWVSPVEDNNNYIDNPDRNVKPIDGIASSEVILFNNELFGCYSTKVVNGEQLGGVQDGLIFWRNRNILGACVEPAHPGMAFFLNEYDGIDPADWKTNFRAWKRGYVSPVLNGWSGSPATYWSNDFYDAVMSVPLTSPNNPYTFKKYVSYTKFTWLNEDGYPRQTAFRDDGLRYQFTTNTSGTVYRMSVPVNWIDRSVTFMANNRYTGWTTADVNYRVNQFGDIDRAPRWFDLNATGQSEIGAYVGPVDADHAHLHTLPSRTGAANVLADPRTVVFVGGDTGPHPEAAVTVDPNGNPVGPDEPIELPSWFKIGADDQELVSTLLSDTAAATPSGAFSAALNVPTLNAREPRFDPYNEVGSDYPSSVGGTYDSVSGLGDAANYTRAWIWGSKMVWDPVNRRVLGICGPHLWGDPLVPSEPWFGPTNGKWQNEHNSILFTYNELSNRVCTYEAPLHKQTPDYNGSGFASHLFDNNTIVGRTLYKMTQPVWTAINGWGYVQPQVIGIDLDAIVEGDYGSVYNGAAVVSDIGRPSDPDITAAVLEYHAALNKIVLFHKNRFWFYDFSTGQWSAETVLPWPGTVISGTTYHAYHNVGSYNPQSGWFVGGGGAADPTGTLVLPPPVRNLKWFGISPQGSVVQLDDSPVCMSVFNDDASVKCASTYLPGTNKHIFFHDNNNVYTLDPTAAPGAQWQTVRTIPTANRPVDWVCAIPDYGCILIGSYGGPVNNKLTNKMTIYKA